MGNGTAAKANRKFSEGIGAWNIQLILLAMFSFTAWADTLGQEAADSTHSRAFTADVGIGASATSSEAVPFWLRTHTFGNIPPANLSAIAFGGICREYNVRPKRKLVDWGFGFSGQLYAGKQSKAILVEAFVKGRLGIFQLKVGRSKDISGIVDSTLSTGSYAISGNALGIPKIEIGIPEFWTVPVLGGVFAFKGSLSHGWMGDVPIQFGRLEGSKAKTYFHNGSVHGRFGRPSWKLKVYAGLNHEVVWGSDKVIFGDQYNLNTVQALWHVVTGKKYTKHGLQRDISKIGNHLGAVDLALDYQFNNSTLLVYRQQFYDKGALAYLANIKDGLTGISLVNKSKDNRRWQWQRILLELFYSKHQAGEADAKETPSGAEYYYNHAVYTEGYSYRGEGLGNPLITPIRYARPGLPNAPVNYFINNRVIAYHLGFQGSASALTYLIKMTYSQNYGEYRTSDIPYWFNGYRFDRTPVFGLFPKVNQFSGLLRLGYRLKNNFHVSSNIAFDTGRLLRNSIGSDIRITKSW